MQQKVHNDIRDVFNMPTRSDAEIQLKKLIEKYGKTAPDLSSWLENELPEGFTVFNVEPDSLNARRKLRTTNMVEFQNKELKILHICCPELRKTVCDIFNGRAERKSKHSQSNDVHCRFELHLRNFSRKISKTI